MGHMLFEDRAGNPCAFPLTTVVVGTVIVDGEQFDRRNTWRVPRPTPSALPSIGIAGCTWLGVATRSSALQETPCCTWCPPRRGHHASLSGESAGHSEKAQPAYEQRDRGGLRHRSDRKRYRVACVQLVESYGPVG